jgi:hypothetical protein
MEVMRGGISSVLPAVRSVVRANHVFIRIFLQRTADLSQLHLVTSVPSIENKGRCYEPLYQADGANLFSSGFHVGTAGGKSCARVPGNTRWMVAQSACLWDKILQTAFQ